MFNHKIDIAKVAESNRHRGRSDGCVQLFWDPLHFEHLHCNSNSLFARDGTVQGDIIIAEDFSLLI